MLTLLVGAGACGGGVEAGGASEAGVLVEGASRVINVEICTVETRDFVERISLTGTVVAGQDVTVSAQESRRHPACRRREGRYCHRGPAVVGSR